MCIIMYIYIYIYVSMCYLCTCVMCVCVTYYVRTNVCMYGLGIMYVLCMYVLHIMYVHTYVLRTYARIYIYIYIYILILKTLMCVSWYHYCIIW